MRIKEGYFVVIAILASMAVAFAQSAPPIAPAAQNNSAASVLRVTSRLVQVNVIAEDRDGKPVTNLTKDDFTVSDEGVAQKISFFAPLIERAADFNRIGVLDESHARFQSGFCSNSRFFKSLAGGAGRFHQRHHHSAGRSEHRFR